MSISSIDPTTGATLRTYPETTAEETIGAIEACQAAFADWSRSSFDERRTLLARAADRLRSRTDELARLMADEMGKPLGEGKAEVEKCALACDYYREHGERFLADEEIATDARTSYVAWRPLGVVLAVMPWNFPFWQVFRFAAPALMAGNGALLKHASNVPGCALAIEEIFREAGAPDGLFRTLLIPSDRVAAIIEHPHVRGVTLTGSTPAGRSVASTAGGLLKKTVLELGGSDPYVLLADADLELAARICATSRLINSGQSCIAAKRFIVVEEVREEFTRLFLERMGEATMGDPREAGTTLGPQARRDLRDELHAQVVRSIELGARVLLGGVVPEGEGAFYPATVLADVTPGMPAFDEELFGPVAAVIGARNEEEAIELANRTSFGLGAAVFTRDLGRGERIARERFEAGCCFVNALVRSDPRLPFGGIKDSGYGRELSWLGIREFVNAKTVYVGG